MSADAVIQVRFNPHVSDSQNDAGNEELREKDQKRVYGFEMKRRPGFYALFVKRYAGESHRCHRFRKQYRQGQRETEYPQNDCVNHHVTVFETVLLEAVTRDDVLPVDGDGRYGSRGHEDSYSLDERNSPTQKGPEVPFAIQQLRQRERHAEEAQDKVGYAQVDDEEIPGDAESRTCHYEQ